MVDDTIDDEKQSTSSTGHFDRHGGAPVRYKVYRPIKEVHGFQKSHRTLPSSDYSLHIAPAAARATISKTTMQNLTTLLAVLMAIAMRR
jgi:hypothetical protein